MEFVGYIAATLTTLSFVPQAYKVLATGDTSGISTWMYTIFVTGTSLWFAYGLVVESWPMVIANVVTTALAGWILALKIINESRASRCAPSQGAA